MTTITFETDEELKAKATSAFESLGMDLTTALNMFLRQTVIKQKYPCSLELDISQSAIQNVKSTYPAGFFELFGKGAGLGLDEEPV